MTLGALLTFIALLVASYSVLSPAYRSLVRIFINLCLLIVTILFVALFLQLPQILSYVGYHYKAYGVLGYVELMELLVPGVSFLLLIGLLAWYGIQLQWLHLSPSHIEKFEDFVTSALKGREYNGLHMVIKSNINSLPWLLRNKSKTLERFFDPAFVDDSVKKRSWIHLKMLALKLENKYLFEILPDRFTSTGNVVRALLRSEVTPIHKEVVARYGGHEGLRQSPEERGLIQSTFLTPKWFMGTAAHYPLVIYATEQLLSGELDKLYNSSPELYVRSQGVSLRSRCPVWIAEKITVLAIKSAIEDGEKGDMYVTTLSDIFRYICGRSEYNSTLWDATPREYPTPYAYLLSEICYDLEGLARDSCGKAWTGNTGIENPNNAPQLREIARTWAVCVWYIADSKGVASEDFRIELVRKYLDFLLRVGFSPRDAVFNSPNLHQGTLENYRNLFMDKLTFLPFADERLKIVNKAIDTLDSGKGWVIKGRQWLENNLRPLLNKSKGGSTRL